jgi:hypothetical protein
MLLDLDAQLSFLLGRPPYLPPRSKVPVPYPSSHTMKTKEYHLHSIIMKISQCSLEICHNARQDETVLGSYLVRLRTCQTELRQLRTENLDFWQAILEHGFEVALLSMALRCRIAVTKRVGLPQYDGHMPRPGEHPTEAECNAIVELAHQIIQIYIHDKSASPSFPRLFGAYTACSFLLSGEVADTATTAEVRNIHKTLHAMLTVLPHSPGSNMAAVPSTKTPEPCRDSRAASIDQRNEGPHSRSIGENASNVSDLQPAASHPVSTSQNYWVVSTASEHVSEPVLVPIPRACPPAPLLPFGMQAPPSVDQPHIEYPWPINTDAVGAHLAHPEAVQHWMFQSGDIYVCDTVDGSGAGPQGDVNTTQASGDQQLLYSC